MRYRVLGSTIQHQFTVELEQFQNVWTPHNGFMWVKKVTFTYFYRTDAEGTDISCRLTGRNTLVNGEMGIRRVGCYMALLQSDAAQSEFEVWLRSMATSHAPGYEVQRDELIPVTAADEWEES